MKLGRIDHWQSGLALATLALGCVPPPTQHPKSEPVIAFPSQSALASYTQKKLDDIPQEKVQLVDEWQVLYPTGEQLGHMPAAASTPWTRALQHSQAVRDGSVVLTEGMQCVASELGRFYEQHQAIPDPALSGFVLGRCGCSATAVNSNILLAHVAEDAVQQQIADDLRPRLASEFAAISPKKGMVGGVNFRRTADGQGVITLVTAESKATLNPNSAVPRDGVIILSGQVSQDPEDILALINDGDAKVKDCSRLPAQLPRFTFRCPVSSTPTWADIIVTGHKRLLSEVVASAYIHGNSDQSRHFVRKRSPSEIATAEQLIEEFNAVRRSAGIKPLKHVSSQSQVNKSVTPALIVAGIEEDAEATDTISLGLLAGWQVPGMKRMGAIYFNGVPGNRTRDWLHLALMRPLGRSVLLDPDASSVALGLSSNDQLVGGVATVYYEYDKGDDDAQRTAVFEALTQRRIEAGLAAPQLVASEDLDLAVQHLNEGTPPMGALSAAALEMQWKLDPATPPMYFETLDAALIEFPLELLRPGAPRVAISVTHHQPEGAAWGQYVVFLAVLQ